MKSRKQKLDLYKEVYDKYLNMEDNTLLQLQEWCKENKIDEESMLEKATERALYILKNQKYYTMRIILYEEPFKTERPRVGFYKNIYSPNAANNHKYMRQQLKDLVDRSSKVKDIISSLVYTPSEIKIKAYFPIPKVKKKYAFEVPLFLTGILKVFRDPDYDNIGKAYTDMLNQLLIYDDRMFYKGTVVKLYSILPKVEIEIICQDKHASYTLFNKMKDNKKIKELEEDNLIKLEFLE